MRSTPLLLLLPALVAGCSGPDFTPISRLDKTRVLALRAEPVNLRPGDATTLDLLVYAPPGSSNAITYTWSWCPVLGSAADGYTCPFTDADVQALATQLGASEPPPALVFSHDAAPAFKNVFPAQSLRAVCDNGFGDFKPDCENGYPVRVKVTVENGSESVVATAIVRLPTDVSVASNLNPSIAGIDAMLEGQARSIDDSAQVELPRLVNTTVRARIDAAQSESFMGFDRDNQPAVVKERLVLSWYSEQGDLESTQTAYVDGLSDFERLLENKLKPLTKDDDPADTARVVVVLRDNRGGVSWTTGVVKLGALP